MKRRFQPLLTGALAIAAAGCANRPAAAPFNIIVRGPASSCNVEVDGRKVTTDELLLLARSEAGSGRRVHIGSDMTETPYRCIGGVIYLFQRAGVMNVEFVASRHTGDRNVR